MGRVNTKGFTLLELVLGMALLGIVTVGALATLINLAPRTADPAMEVRAAQFAQRLLNDISLQKFDHNSGDKACGDADALPCTPAGDYGPETDETSPLQFNDVDDYHTPVICNKGLANCNKGWIAACWFTGKADCDAYINFEVKIEVSSSNFNNFNDDLASCSNCAKQVTIHLQQPGGEHWSFAVLRGNFE